MTRAAVRNRSARVTVPTPRGPVEVVRQEVRGLRRTSGWVWRWAARRAGRQDWCEASTARQAIRRATLMPPRGRAGWLEQAAAAAEQQILEPEDAPAPATSDD
jgi:hypothetical protein